MKKFLIFLSTIIILLIGTIGVVSVGANGSKDWEKVKTKGKNPLTVNFVQVVYGKTEKLDYKYKIKRTDNCTPGITVPMPKKTEFVLNGKDKQSFQIAFTEDGIYEYEVERIGTVPKSDKVNFEDGSYFRFGCQVEDGELYPFTCSDPNVEIVSQEEINLITEIHGKNSSHDRGENSSTPDNPKDGKEPDNKAPDDNKSNNKDESKKNNPNKKKREKTTDIIKTGDATVVLPWVILLLGSTIGIIKEKKKLVNKKDTKNK